MLRDMPGPLVPGCTCLFGEDNTTLTIRDDGCGFDVPESPAEMAGSGHFGLLGIQERAEIIGALVVN